MTSIILLSEYTITSLVSYKQWREFQICGWTMPSQEVKRSVVKLALTLQSRLWKTGKFYQLILEVGKTIYVSRILHTHILSQMLIRKLSLWKWIMQIKTKLHLHIILGCLEKHLQNKLKYISKWFVSQVNRSVINLWYKQTI